MMTENTILNYLLAINDEHRNDKDGGIDAVNDIVSFFQQLAHDHKYVFIKTLVQLVKNRDSKLGGLALGAISRCPFANTGPELYAVVKEDHGQDEWSDQIYFSLVFLGHKDSIRDCIQYIETALSSNRYGVVPIIAAFCRTDQSEYLKLAPRFLVEMVDRSPDLLERLVPAFMANLFEQNLVLFEQLLVKVKSIHSEAYIKISRLFADEINKPWNRQRYPQGYLDEYIEIIENIK